ncbi:MAG: FtsW/RodA/SpoVE family cell cycle protein [Muribaculaceae bacterium]|nr:FtsW/RodA/SpoVE family cell cycle protein [Muribaculaceae bacterium]
MENTISLESAQAAPVAAAPAKTRVRTDHHIWGTYILLVIVAVIELFSASIQEVTDDGIFSPVLRHGMFIVAGLLAMLLLQRIHYRIIYKAIPCFVGLSLILMIAVYFGGTKVNGAMRAITIAGVTILPAEFLKLSAALGTAYILSKTQMPGKRDVTTRGLVLCLGFMFFCAGLLFSQGLSNTILVVSICYAMMLVGGMGWKKFLIALAIGGVVGGAGYLAKTHVKENVVLTPQQERVIQLNGEGSVGGASGRGNVWNDRTSYWKRPNKHLDDFDVDHQQEQLSFIAQAHGGLTGVGIGRSRENARLPLAFSDYIFAIIIEELGLFVGLGILIVYMWILGRSAKLTMCFKHTMPGVLVMGCSFVIVFQALYHMAIVSGVFPVSGQPLPLISKGGISVIVTSIAFGIMLSVARHAVRVTDTKAEQKQEQNSLPEDARSLNPVMSSVVEEK